MKVSGHPLFFCHRCCGLG